MTKLLIAVVSILMWQRQVCADLRFHNFKKVEETVEESADMLWSVDNTSSKLMCTTLCLAESRCATFGFVEEKDSCQAFGPGVPTAMGKQGFTTYYSKGLWNSTFNNETDNDREDGDDGEDNITIKKDADEVGRKSAKGSNPLESKCSTNTDCPADREFVCFTGTCMCEPGYSFNPSNNSCVRRCKSYGSMFRRYFGLGVKHHNDGDERSDISMMECYQKCLREETFTCITFETHRWKKSCYISKYGYLDVVPKDREKGLLDWSYSVRDCV